MKIVFLNGSYRANGNTERLLKLLDGQFQKAAGERGIALETEHVLLARREIQVCRGCRRCFDRGECPLDDDVCKIGELIAGCDALVLASPVYMEDVNGIMKNWIDRMAFRAHRPAFYGKCAAAVSTSGAGSTNHTLNTMKNALTAWGFQVVSTGKFRMGALMETAEAEKLYAARTAKLAGKLIDAAARGAAERPSLLSLLSFAIMQRYYRSCPRAGAVDRAYWEEKGWLDPRTPYYMPIHVCAAKRVLVRGLGAVLAKMFV